MKSRFAVCIALIAALVLLDSPVWTQEKPPFSRPFTLSGPPALTNPPEVACRPECEDALAKWESANEAAELAKQQFDAALKVVSQIRAELDIADKLVKAAKDPVPQDLLRARAGAREASEEAHAKSREAKERFDQALWEADFARTDYMKCCPERRRKSRAKVLAPIIGGAGAAVAILAGTGSDAPTTTTAATPPSSATPPSVPSPQPSPTPPPTQTPTPTPPPASPRPSSGTFDMGDLNGRRIYQVMFSDSNVDVNLPQVNLALIDTNCNPPYFFPQFTANINITGTGPFSQPLNTITGSGTGSFLIGGEQILGTLTLTITGADLTIKEHLTRLNCFGDFFAQLRLPGF
jgi:hypothetical protein